MVAIMLLVMPARFGADEYNLTLAQRRGEGVGDYQLTNSSNSDTVLFSPPVEEAKRMPRTRTVSGGSGTAASLPPFREIWLADRRLWDGDGFVGVDPETLIGVYGVQQDKILGSGIGLTIIRFAG